MKRQARLLLIAAPLAAAAVACSLLTSFDDSLLAEASFERCRDHADNDSDGLIDCDDPSCAAFSICAEITASACADRLDNDGDGVVDCLDPGCAALPGVCVEQTRQACSDGQDNDADQLVDCNDPDCRALDLCQEKSGAECSDGVDNDQDGLTDCRDFDCYGTSACCQDPPPQLPADLTAAGSCTIHACSEAEPTCCTAGYERCNPFNAQRWVAWGLPRARADEEGLVPNQPCKCGSSGLVSVEHVRLQPGLQVRFQLDLPAPGQDQGSLCGGLTLSAVFPDDEKQCSRPSPRLLLGLCLESPTAGSRRVAAIVDGVEEAEATLPHATPVEARIRLEEDGVQLSAGPLLHRTTALEPSLSLALVLLHGRGTQGRISSLVVQGSALHLPRCQDPTAWYRHLGRGEPVIRGGGPVQAASEPTVIYQPEAKSHLMVFVGASAGKTALYRAVSPDGVGWTITPEPIIPPTAGDVRFGAHQGGPSLLYREGVYHLWYTRDDEAGGSLRRSIGHAVSVDGRVWKPGEDAGSEPALMAAAPPAWDSLSVSSPSVIVAADGSLVMFYTGTGLELAPRPAIGVARSTDAISWTRLHGAPVVSPAADQDLGCEGPAAVYDAGRKQYLLWYTHRTVGGSPTIRHAVSLDTRRWSVYAGGPALPPGPLGTFDDRGVEDPAVMLEGRRVLLWFTGLSAAGVRQVGYAENRGSF